MGNKYNGSVNRQGDADDKFLAAGAAQRRSHAAALAVEPASDGSEFADREASKKALEKGLSK